MIIFRKVTGSKDCHFGQFGTNNARYNSRYLRVSGELIHLRNRFKLVKRSLFAIIGLLQGAKFILLDFIWRVGDGFSKKKNSNFRKLVFFILFYLIEFLNVITAPKSSQNIQGRALIRRVLLCLRLFIT